MNKKKCPKCGLELPEESHFCPRCMYEYPRTELVHFEKKQKKRHYTAIVVGVVLVAFLLPMGGIAINRTIGKNVTQGEIEKQQQLSRIFRTGEDIPNDDGMIYDLRDCLTEWEIVRQKLGKETKEPVSEGEYTIHTFENVEISVDDNGIVQDIYIRYEEVIDKERYGLYGFCGSSERNMIKEIIGVPEQNYGENEYLYRFEGLEGTPTLCFRFSNSGIVEEIEYYR